jgi:hypothetical protein
LRIGEAEPNTRLDTNHSESETPNASRRREAVASNRILRRDNMESYRLISYQATGGARAGVVVGEHIFDLAAATGNPNDSALLDFYADWQAAPARLAGALAAGPKTGPCRWRRRNCWRRYSIPAGSIALGPITRITPPR